ncbi:hypothetical protein [uncultured Gimesia sp.]|mgnify:CR=1 FL=1|uniref:hypothetical protein n=1 Tax=uncultured Gimesia sp. TaxID=1678688 RepID=UPI0030DC0B3C|tara:strand:+ start:41584 stop:42438 length:855 start_codon:yes stop_codon:yes gene_type:complete
MNQLIQRPANRSIWLFRWLYPARTIQHFPRTAEGDSAWQRQHDEVSRTIRRTLFLLISYCFFSLLVILEATNGVKSLESLNLIPPDNVTLPFVSVRVDFGTFTIFGLLILFGMTAYLHIFVEQWIQLGAYHRRPNRTPLPFLFNLDTPSARGLTFFLLYWMPLVIALLYLVAGYIDQIDLVIRQLAAQLKLSGHVSERIAPRKWLIISLMSYSFAGYLIALQLRRLPQRKTVAQALLTGCFLIFAACSFTSGQLLFDPLPMTKPIPRQSAELPKGSIPVEAPLK